MSFMKAWITAFRAGMIVSRCTTGCVADDATESIFACPIHEDEIARLAKENLDAQS